MHAEARDYLIEDQCGAGLLGEPPDLFQEFYRLQARMAALDRLNQYRRQNGARVVDASPTLIKTARRHAHDMATHNFMLHTGSDGSDPTKRAKDAGYPLGVSENILRGTPRAVEAMAGALE